jgi:ATP-dependent DNA helicase RecG
MSATSLEKSSVTTLKGVGPALGEKLARLGIKTVANLVFHLPLRYEDRTRITPIAAVQPGQTMVLEGSIVACDVTFGRRRSLLAYLQDDTGKIALRFFHFSNAQKESLKNATSLRCYGEVRRGASGFEIYHPEYQAANLAELDTTLTPVYPLTEGLGQNKLRNLLQQILTLLDANQSLSDFLQGRVQFSMSLSDALRYVHSPPPDANLEQLASGTHPAQQRLAFEELLAHQISMQFIRQEISRQMALSFEPPGRLCDTFQDKLAFRLTNAQIRVRDEIAQDLNKHSPMLRLVQGDVGSGKTVVAAIAAIQAIENGVQAAIMAPTEILAEQHLANFSTWLEPLDITVAWLSSKVKGKQRQETLAKIANGEAQLIVGTHALFQKEVDYYQLGLLIIDEQHRFGVQQRLDFREKGRAKDESKPRLPHQLVMTATPIPRTLTMSMYADMDSSVIDELPPGRTPVTTHVMPDSKRPEVIERIAIACRSGAQAYWVCTLIEESEVLDCQAAEVTAAELTELLPRVRVGLVHGRLKANEKSAVMNRFKAGEIDLLVATTVIEVGVDVPNASLMIIENPERLGLAQLHQLRGRIGRGSAISHCLLLYHPPLGQISKQRLNVMRESSDGFYIAERDLEIRGPGEIFGSRQSGSIEFRVADLMRDQHMLDEIRTASVMLVSEQKKDALALMERWLTDPTRTGQV